MIVLPYANVRWSMLIKPHQPGSPLSTWCCLALQFTLLAPGWVSQPQAAFLGAGTGNRTARSVTSPGCWQPLCCESIFWCRCHLVACTERGNMQGWLTGTAGTPVKNIVDYEVFLLQFGVWHGSHFLDIAFDSLFFKSPNYPHLFTLVYSGNLEKLAFASIPRPTFFFFFLE